MTKLSQIIAKEIRDKDVIPFARFMELALYCPDYGFYEKERDNLGAGGHFYTSVSVGQLFGELLAVQFAEWFDEGLESPMPYQLVEAGAHDGRLASDILNWFAAYRPVLLARLQYSIIEPSHRRRQWQENTLAKFKHRVRWFSSLADLPCHSSPASRHLFQIIFCNELLDAMPVHRFRWDAKAKNWFELGVKLSGYEFTWKRPEGAGADINVSTPQLLKSSTLKQLTPFLPDGFVLDICPAAELWWQTAAQSLIRGKLLTLDYGLTSEELLQPERKDGTLRGYYQHRMTTDVLANPGEHDLTAHVNFSAIQAAGEAAGMRTESFVTQERFLAEIVARNLQNESAALISSPAQKRQFQTLTHPNLMGRQFRVLVQGR